MGHILSVATDVGTITPSQYRGHVRLARYQAGRLRVHIALIEDAVKCWKGEGGTNPGQRKRYRQEAEEWLFDESFDGPFSFYVIAEALGIEPSWFRTAPRAARSSS